MNETRSRDSRWERLKVFAGLLVVVFTVTLVAIISDWLSDESLAVLAGAACGVGAAIPTSLLIVAVSRRRDERREPVSAPQGAYPPVIVVAPQERQSAGAAESRSGELEFKGRGVGQRVTKQEEEE